MIFWPRCRACFSEQSRQALASGLYRRTTAAGKWAIGRCQKEQAIVAETDRRGAAALDVVSGVLSIEDLNFPGQLYKKRQQA
jgi:hypothetical protein